MFNHHGSKTKNRNSAFAPCGFELNHTLVGILPPEIQDGAAIIEHQQQSREEKQGHDDVENTVSLSTRVFDFVHVVLQNFCGAKNVRQK